MFVRSILLSASIGLLSVAQDAQAQHASLSVLHGIPGLPAPVEVFVDNARLFAFDYLDSEGPFDLPAATYAVEVRLNGTAVLSANVPLQGGRNYTAIAHLTATGSNTLSLFDNDISPIQPGQSRITVRHTAQAPAVDIAVDLNGSRFATLSNLTNPNEVVADVPAQLYDASVLVAGTTTVAFGPVPLDLAADVSYLIHAVGDVSGTSFTVLVQTIDFSPHYAVSFGGTACVGQISSDTANASVGSSFQLFLSGAAPSAASVLLFGDNNVSFSGVPLPADLGVLGAPGCSLYTNSIGAIPATTNPIGLAAVAVTLPPGVGRFLETAYFQWASATSSNPLGFGFTGFAALTAN